MATTSTTPQAAGTATAGAVPAAIKKEGKETRKRRPVTSKTTRIQPYPTSESGSPILPLTAGVMTILELGEIVHDRPAYHAERYIYPVGYKSKRSFLSMIDAAKQTMYLCEVLDGGDSPMFVVTPEDCPERAVSAGSLTGAWIPIFKAAYALRNKEHASGLSGPEFFGFTQGIVMKVIQELPGSRLCKNYVWQEVVQ
ncbi:F/Y-rich N-terminus-domain-containing protein [Obelidium mucronatum]|nr:F/Y-rich N-terminus-domain-containing protein [Obelidium mucronatum]